MAVAAFIPTSNALTEGETPDSAFSDALSVTSENWAPTVDSSCALTCSK